MTGLLGERCGAVPSAGTAPRGDTAPLPALRVLLVLTRRVVVTIRRAVRARRRILALALLVGAVATGLLPRLVALRLLLFLGLFGSAYVHSPFVPATAFIR